MRPLTTGQPDTDAVVRAIRCGECVVMPTDTVYGIAADAFDPRAVQRLLDAKGRGRDMPPPVLIADAEGLDEIAVDVPDGARALAEAFWPGALTLIVPARPRAGLDLGDTHGTIAVRVPDHDLARALLRCTGPLAVSSANTTGLAPATTVDQARAMLGDSVARYVDGGPTPGQTPSTILDFASSRRGHVVRQGAIDVVTLRAVWPGLEG